MNTTRCLDTNELGIELLLRDIDILDQEIERLKDEKTLRETRMLALEKKAIAEVGVVYQNFMTGLITTHECFMGIDSIINQTVNSPTK